MHWVVEKLCRYLSYLLLKFSYRRRCFVCRSLAVFTSDLPGYRHEKKIVWLCLSQCTCVLAGVPGLQKHPSSRGMYGSLRAAADFPALLGILATTRTISRGLRRFQSRILFIIYAGTLPSRTSTFMSTLCRDLVCPRMRLADEN